MKTKVRLSLQSIVITGAMICFLFSNMSIYANSTDHQKLVKSNSEKIAKQLDKINNYSELLKNANEKKSESIERRIENAQSKIRQWEDEIYSETNVNKYRPLSLPFTKYDFDVAENSLVVNDVMLKRNGKTDDFHLGFKTSETGTARIDIVSPGGELLKSITVSDFNGSFGEEIQLSSENGEVYFAHIDVNGKQTTKKLLFK